ncbi:g13448 [Coccomyxa viridis]|uniref:Histone H4 n=1 Tax=Coccomyxa viridis TaxID=1274662 RepID=A0ABP1GJX6_9CHLO
MTKWSQKCSRTPKRFAQVALGSAQNGHICKNAVRRLARKAGVKRMSGDVSTEARTALRSFLQGIIHDVVIITEHSRRQTATVMDVLLALKRRGRQLYGFGVPICLGASDTRRKRRRTLREANAEEEALRQAALGDLSAASPAMHPAKHPQAVPIVYQTPTTEVPLEAAPAKQQNGYYKELGPCTPDAGLDEEHAWRIRKALGAFSMSPAAQQLTIASTIPEVHARLQPFLGGTPCTVAQLRTMARRLGEDDSIEVYYDPTEDRLILD